MRRRRKSDWFSIVATDLFCGALCAVIVLDAVAKRAPSTIEGPGRVALSYDKPAAGCDSVLVVGVLDTAGGEHFISTRGSFEDGGKCRKEMDLLDRTGVDVRRLVLARGVKHVVVEVNAGALLNVTCSTKAASC